MLTHGMFLPLPHILHQTLMLMLLWGPFVDAIEIQNEFALGER